MAVLARPASVPPGPGVKVGTTLSYGRSFKVYFEVLLNALVSTLGGTTKTGTPGTSKAGSDSSLVLGA